MSIPSVHSYPWRDPPSNSPHRRRRRGLPSYIRNPLNIVSQQNRTLLLLALVIAINPLVLLWHYYYVSAVIHPLQHQTRATSYFFSKLEFAAICILSAFLMVINATCSFKFFLWPLFRSWQTNQFLRLEPVRISPVLRKTIYIITVIFSVSLALTFTLFQFITPFFTPAVSWHYTYMSACKNLQIHVNLDSPTSIPTPDLIFSHPSGVNYTMRMDPNPWATSRNESDTLPWVAVEGHDMEWMRGLAGSGYRFYVVSASDHTSPLVPDWIYVRYNIGLVFGEMSFQIFGANDTLIESGIFQLGKVFEVSTMGLSGDLEGFASRCVFDPTVEILAAAEGEPKRVVMKTVQKEVCGLLEVCADEALADMVAVPVGLLVLMRSMRGMGCCKNGRIPGVEARDWSQIS